MNSSPLDDRDLRLESPRQEDHDWTIIVGRDITDWARGLLEGYDNHKYKTRLLFNKGEILRDFSSSEFAIKRGSSRENSSQRGSLYKKLAVLLLFL